MLKAGATHQNALILFDSYASAELYCLLKLRRILNKVNGGIASVAVPLVGRGRTARELIPRQRAFEFEPAILDLGSAVREQFCLRGEILPGSLVLELFVPALEKLLPTFQIQLGTLVLPFL